MLMVCAWCDRVLLPDGRTMSMPETMYCLSRHIGEISHGVCLKCKDKLHAEAEEKTKQRESGAAS